MRAAIYLVVIGATFGLCYFFDKGFQKHFRGKQQHRSGLAVKPAKMYAIAGIALSFLGICAIFTGLNAEKALLYGGILLLPFGVGLCVYYLSSGIFYDDESFLSAGFGKKDRTYRYGDIVAQKLYVITGGSLVVELHMRDGKAVPIHTTMGGAYAFLDAAFAGWCCQNGIDPDTCDFHDPMNHLWFPQEEI